MFNPVPEAYDSKQSYKPQPLQTLLCPESIGKCISPAAPDFPLSNFLSTIIPDPTPVPNVKIIAFLHPFAAPIENSAHAAELASFSIKTGLELNDIKSVLL